MFDKGRSGSSAVGQSDDQAEKALHSPRPTLAAASRILHRTSAAVILRGTRGLLQPSRPLLVSGYCEACSSVMLDERVCTNNDVTGAFGYEANAKATAAERPCLPCGTSDLTASPYDDLDACEDWVELAEVSVKSGPEGFWHCVEQWTYDIHWNRTIWKMDVVHAETVPSGISSDDAGDPREEGATLAKARHIDSAEPTEKHDIGRPCGVPNRGSRRVVLRKLYRKTPSPIGGGANATEPSHEADEWTLQYVSNRTGRHVCIFGFAVPDKVCQNGNPKGLRYWPFQYPKVRALAVTYEPGSPSVADNTDNAGDTGDAGDAGNADDPRGLGTLRYHVIPLSADVCSTGRDFESTRVHASKSAMRLLKECRKRAERYDPIEMSTTYTKRVVHDVHVDEAQYRLHYDRLKKDYGTHWAANWPEVTDPTKFVYEELAIAAYLMTLFDKERESTGGPKQSFVDLGCGNGFLTYLLIAEGYPGKGYDIQRRGIWDKYPPEVTACLVQEKIDPETYTCPDVDWIIGNHSDELTPWIPAIAARSQREHDSDASNPGDEAADVGSRPANPRFFLLPCCFFDFDGRKYCFGTTRRTFSVKDTGDGKYAQYLRYIERICVAFGFGIENEIERENLRIPSTKYIAFIGRIISRPERIQPDTVSSTIRLALRDAEMSHA